MPMRLRTDSPDARILWCPTRHSSRERCQWQLTTGRHDHWPNLPETCRSRPRFCDCSDRLRGRKSCRYRICETMGSSRPGGKTRRTNPELSRHEPVALRAAFGPRRSRPEHGRSRGPARSVARPSRERDCPTRRCSAPGSSVGLRYAPDNDAPSPIALLRIRLEVRVPYLLPVELGPGQRSSRVQRLQHRPRHGVVAEILQQMP